MPLTIEEFEQLRTDFLATQDNNDKDEWYCTELVIADNVFGNLRKYLFGSYDEMMVRRAQYEELKKEFGPSN